MPSPLEPVRLAHHPTPLEPLDRLSAELGGPRIWVKRDDATGLAIGGNKVRKLEYLLADAIGGGADVVVTIGATQSNHCRQTAAAAARLGVDCELLLEHRFPDWSDDYNHGGNRQLDTLFGATVHDHERGTDMVAALDSRAAALRAAGRMPYVVPLGGSSVVGSLGYHAAAGELLDQCDALGVSPAEIVHATSSGGTQAGLLAGLASADRSIPVLGVSAGAPATHLGPIVAELAAGVLDLLGDSAPVAADAVVIDDAHVGEAYGVPTDAMHEALDLCARLEGLLLDPVYTGKGMAGLIHHVRAGRHPTDADVVFVHTGGTPALFAYRRSERDAPIGRRGRCPVWAGGCRWSS
ncbi:MAG: D-cysteine desulfhydrase family protein [Actinomycetota bacterium]